VERGMELLPERNELETDIASMRVFADNERLSCQLPPIDGLVLNIPQSLPDDDLDRT
jgi:hypothetical protein